MRITIQTKDITKQFNICRTNLYYLIRTGKISKPKKGSNGHYLWEKKYIEEIADVLKIKTEYGVNKDIKVKSFEISNRRYLGNKYRLIPFIKKVIKEHCEDCKTFFDVFSGTGVVAETFREYRLITNDILYSNYLSHYTFFSHDTYDKRKLIKLIDEFNNVKDIKEDNYMSINFGQKYYSQSVARKIGYIREKIDTLSKTYKVNKREEYILITSLIYAMDKIANTCGHYDAYRKTQSYDDDFLMKFPNIKKCNDNNEVYNTDSNELVRKVKCDIAYIDPPYNSRQYSDLYHLLENIARWEKPEVFGVAAKMDRTNIKSDYCTKNAPNAFEDLINNLESKYILVSYNNMGDKGNGRSNAKITDEEILDILKTKGEVKTFEISYKAFTTGKTEVEDHKERLFLCVTYKEDTLEKETKVDIPSPLNYTGGKFKLLDQIKPKFPIEFDNVIDLFSGGCNVGINVECENVKFIDKQYNLMRLFNTLKNHAKEEIINQIYLIIEEFKLSNSEQFGYSYYNVDSSKGLGEYNKEQYLLLRQKYNTRAKDSFYYDIVFYVLIVFGFNNQIRFNQKGEFNLPVGKRDFNFKMKSKLTNFVDRLKEKNYQFITEDFTNIKAKDIDKKTFVYADPPYLITTASYNEQGGWNEDNEKKLLRFLDELNNEGIKFALSNVLESKGKRNEILIDWTKINRDKYKIHYLSNDYSNSNYQTKDRSKNSTIEVLIINY